MPQTTHDVREVVRERYAAAARRAGVGADAGCCGSEGGCSSAVLADEEKEVFGAELYGDEANQAPAEAVAASLGCGVPTAVAELHEGEVVLDLGSGAGADVLISARRVGPTGRAIGLDMTEEMLELARRNAAEAGLENVDWLEGRIEEIPLPDASVDVVISNCVINLSVDKPRVLREAARVLTPGGRFAVSDVIADADMDEATRADMAAWTGCIAGALTHAEFEDALLGAGFVDVEIRPTHSVHEHADAAVVRARKPTAAERATMTAVASRLHEPQALYRQWEQGQWDPWKVELERDRGDWARLGEDDRGLVLWALSSLMVAEERITTQFAALVMAGESEEETSYLATQQVDEARHMQFYARYQDEVIADPASIDAHVQRARTRLGPSFGVIFDEALVHAHARLAAAPRDPAAKVAFVTTYHMVIEGTLGLTAFNFISRYFEDQDVLGGFVEGYARIHHDEQRHLAYGTWYLQQAVAGRAELGDTVRATLRELLPAVAAALSPPDREGVDFEALGAGSDEIRQFALTGLTRRLAVVGVPIETVAG